MNEKRRNDLDSLFRRASNEALAARGQLNELDANQYQGLRRGLDKFISAYNEQQKKSVMGAAHQEGYFALGRELDGLVKEIKAVAGGDIMRFATQTVSDATIAASNVVNAGFKAVSSWLGVSSAETSSGKDKENQSENLQPPNKKKSPWDALVDVNATVSNIFGRYASERKLSLEKMVDGLNQEVQDSLQASGEEALFSSDNTLGSTSETAAPIVGASKMDHDLSVESPALTQPEVAPPAAEDQQTNVTNKKAKFTKDAILSRMAAIKEKGAGKRTAEDEKLVSAVRKYVGKPARSATTDSSQPKEALKDSSKVKSDFAAKIPAFVAARRKINPDNMSEAEKRYAEIFDSRVAAAKVSQAQEVKNSDIMTNGVQLLVLECQQYVEDINGRVSDKVLREKIDLLRSGLEDIEKIYQNVKRDPTQVDSLLKELEQNISELSAALAAGENKLLRQGEGASASAESSKAKQVYHSGVASDYEETLEVFPEEFEAPADDEAASDFRADKQETAKDMIHVIEEARETYRQGFSGDFKFEIGRYKELLEQGDLSEQNLVGLSQLKDSVVYFGVIQEALAPENRARLGGWVNQLDREFSNIRLLLLQGKVVGYHKTLFLLQDKVENIQRATSELNAIKVLLNAEQKILAINKDRDIWRIADIKNALSFVGEIEKREAGEITAVLDELVLIHSLIKDPHLDPVYTDIDKIKELAAKFGINRESIRVERVDVDEGKESAVEKTTIGDKLQQRADKKNIIIDQLLKNVDPSKLDTKLDQLRQEVLDIQGRMQKPNLLTKDLVKDSRRMSVIIMKLKGMKMKKIIRGSGEKPSLGLVSGIKARLSGGNKVKASEEEKKSLDGASKPQSKNR
jgi:hypothetical protein